MLQGFEPFLVEANDDGDPLLQFIIDGSREPAGNSIPLNEIVKLNKLEAFGALYPWFPPDFLKDEYFEEQVCGIIFSIIASTPVYRLQCLPDKPAAELVKKTVFNWNLYDR